MERDVSEQSRSVAMCRGWVRLYTRRLPAEVGERRILEFESDLWEQLHDPTEARRPRSILGRTIRGIYADVWWRYRTLLEERGASTRSDGMETTTANWWTPVTMVLGIVMATMGLLGLTLGGTDGGGTAVRLLAALPPAFGGLVLLGGLAVRRHQFVAGSRLIIAGAVLAAMDPVFIPISAFVIIGGMWTGNVVASQRPDVPRLEIARRSMTTGWYRWLIAAAVLGAAGLGILLFWENSGFVPDDCNLCWQDSAAWATWILSWMTAMVTAGIGVALGVLRLFGRHNARQDSPQVIQ
jgi:hypothetical protein